jgi:hypothetical protein
MFREILFACLFQPIIGLAKDNESGRIADLFPEEVRDQRGLRQGVVGTLLTIVSFHHHCVQQQKTNCYARYIIRSFVGVRQILKAEN